MKHVKLVVFATILLAFSSIAQAANVSALVENAEKSATSLSVMQFLETGAVVDVGSGGTIVLSYLRSCIREEISGGQVTIGERQSSITGGLVVREKVNCDSDQYVLTQEQSNESGATAFRANPDGDPVVTVYGTRPIFLFEKTPEAMTIERRDIRGKLIMLRPSQPVFDLSASAVSLVPGGTYNVTVEGRSVTVLVDRSARGSHVSAVSRLVRF
ncbi:MAG: hypothetical protein HOJ90_14450 [Alphaproteobacteria bacterium]|jgi:hypothetical protein|nr:hypothetical protein [Alphaproteobacteria bacterium]